jgi:hypothetical protein
MLKGAITRRRGERMRNGVVLPRLRQSPGVINGLSLSLFVRLMVIVVAYTNERRMILYTL